MTELVCVDPARVSDFWPFVEKSLRAAIEINEISDFDCLERDVLDGKQLLWLAVNGKTIEACATTALVKPFNRKICIITACSGHHRERWLHLKKSIEEYAKNEGCAEIELFGRRGWERALDDYKVHAIILRKAL